MKYIAHIRSDQTEQSTLDHLLQTADWCETFGRKISIAKAARLVGVVHDLGKFTAQFVHYIFYSAAHPEDHSMRGKIPHAIQGAKYLVEHFAAASGSARLSAHLLALAVISHHGGLMDCVAPDGEAVFFDRLDRDDAKHCYKEATTNFEAALGETAKALFPEALDELITLIGRCKAAGIGGWFSVHLIEKFLFSCLIDADRYDTYRFMAGLPANEEAEALPPWDELSTRLLSHIGQFQADTPINKLRAEISERCLGFAQKKTGVFQLCVPTGGGKTLASLRFALEHARIHQKDRIIYVIPYTSIIDQTAGEIRKILRRDDLIFEHHSNLLPDEAEDEDVARSRELLSERWDAPIILTTMVQFLNTLYAGGTRSVRRMHSLSNAVLIFDEIQSIPVSCIHLFNGALNFLSNVCGTTAVLCTATQPLLDKTARRLLLSKEAQMVQNAEEVFRSFRRTRLVDACVDGGYTPDALCGFLLEKGESARTILAILNTKRDVLRLYEKVVEANALLPAAKRFRLYHLSTSMCPAHRQMILRKIKKELPKGRVICVSSQLVEAGVDFSFQCVIRALAGLDSIAQAAGRCNRHGEEECRDVFIVNIRGENLKMLESIKAGQEAAKKVLWEVKSHAFEGDDPLLPAAMRRYYELYFYSRKEEMDYNVPKLGASLYTMLDNHDVGRHAYAERPNAKPSLPFFQAYKTSGEHFHAIDDNTRAVLVPYGHGRCLIESLNKRLPLSQRKSALRMAQRYAVNLYDHTFLALLKDRAIYQLTAGVWALAEGCYDKDRGLVQREQGGDAFFA